jgi:hypothetical protein
MCVSLRMTQQQVFMVCFLLRAVDAILVTLQIACAIVVLHAFFISLALLLLYYEAACCLWHDRGHRP